MSISSDGGGIINTNAAKETWLVQARYGLTEREMAKIHRIQRDYLRQVVNWFPETHFTRDHYGRNPPVSSEELESVRKNAEAAWKQYRKEKRHARRFLTFHSFEGEKVRVYHLEKSRTAEISIKPGETIGLKIPAERSSYLKLGEEFHILGEKKLSKGPETFRVIFIRAQGIDTPKTWKVFDFYSKQRAKRH